MKRLLEAAVLLHLAHLAEEALERMHDDPLIAHAYSWLQPLGERHAAYLVFQLTFAAGLVAVTLVARGGAARRAVFALFGVALLAEIHHPIRALLTLASNPGLATSLPLPALGALVFARSLSNPRNPS